MESLESKSRNLGVCVGPVSSSSSSREDTSIISWSTDGGWSGSGGRAGGGVTVGESDVERTSLNRNRGKVWKSERKEGPTTKYILSVMT